MKWNDNNNNNYINFEIYYQINFISFLFHEISFWKKMKKIICSFYSGLLCNGLTMIKEYKYITKYYYMN